MKQKTLSDILLIILFSIFCGCMAAGFYFTKDAETSYYENRSLAKMPQISFEGISDGTFGNEIENYLSDHTAERDNILKYKAKADIYLLRRPVVNGIVVGDTLLPFCSYEPADKSETLRKVALFTEDIKSIKSEVESYGGELVFVTVPSQNLYYKDEYPAYLNDGTDIILNTVMPAFKKSMNEANVNYVDMYEVAKSLGMPEYMSSKTDHHYSLRGAVFTWRTVVDTVSENTDIKINFPSDGEIEYTAYKNPYLGSRNRKIIGQKYNDEKLLKANFKEYIPFERYNNGKKTYSVLYIDPQNSEVSVSYPLYMGGDFGNTVIKTHRENLPNVLIYGASFTNAIETVAYASCNEMHSVDMRHFKDMSLLEYVKENKPDLVVGVFDWGNISELSADGKY